MLEIPRLDIMIAYSCNISCAGCISISDRKRDGVAPLEEIESWIQHWAPLVSPKVVTLFGGEPCLHPDLIDICSRVRWSWPDATIRLVTNGYLLKNFDSQAWFDFEPMEIQVSIHRADHEEAINKNIRDILLNRINWKITKNNNPKDHRHMIWSTNELTIYKSKFHEFVVPFRDDLAPWHSDPVQAHAICGAPDTPILYKGMLYKCPAVANIMDLTQQNWFNYQPCQDQNGLEEFVQGIGQPEPVCAQCPNKSQAQVIDHSDIKNVQIRQKNFG